MMASPSKPLTWLITGCSSGFGLALARAVLARGHNVIATSRNPSKSPELVREIEAAERGRWLALDVTWSQAEINAAFAGAEALFPGGIDVVVNNSASWVMSSVEDLPEDVARAQFDTNFWGVLRVTKAALPGMRARGKGGVIVNISSIAGLTALAGSSIYAASKHALEALTDSLGQEVAEFGIRCLLVEPGAFRTGFLTPNTMTVATPSEPYRAGPVQATLDRFLQMNGKQVGDPAKAAERIFDVVTGTGVGEGKTNYLRLPLGKDCMARAVAKTESVRENLEAFREVAESTDI